MWEGVCRWGKREIIYLSLNCHHQNDFCIKVGSDGSHFNVSLIVRDKITRQRPQTTTFQVKGELTDSNRGPSAYQPTALPRGQTSSRMWMPVLGIFNQRTDIHAFDCTQGLYELCKRVCTKGWLWEECPLLHAPGTRIRLRMAPGFRVQHSDNWVIPHFRFDTKYIQVVS